MGTGSSQQIQDNRGLPNAEAPTHFQNIEPLRKEAKLLPAKTRANPPNDPPTAESQVREGKQRPRHKSVLMKTGGPFPHSMVLNTSQVSYKPTEVYNSTEDPLSGFESKQLRGKFINLVDLRCETVPKNLIKDSLFFDERESVQEKEKEKEKKNPETFSAKPDSRQANSPTNLHPEPKKVALPPSQKGTAEEKKEPAQPNQLEKIPASQNEMVRASHIKKTQKLKLDPTQSRLRIGETEVFEIRRTGSVPSFLNSKEIELKECMDRQINYAQPRECREIVHDSNYIDESRGSRYNLKVEVDTDLLNFSVGDVKCYLSPQVKTYVYTQCLTDKIKE